MNTLQHYQVGSRFSSTINAASEALQLVYTTELRTVAQETIAFYTSPQAKLVYRLAGKAAIWTVTAIAAVAFISGMKAREWADAYVQQCLTEASTEVELAVEAVAEEAIASIQFQTAAIGWTVDRAFQVRVRVKAFGRSVLVLLQRLAVTKVETLTLIGNAWG